MEEVVQVKPIVHTRLERPPLETPMVKNSQIYLKQFVFIWLNTRWF